MAHHLEPVPSLRSPSPPTWLTLSIAEAAELVGISRTTAYELAQSGELPTVRLGRRILVPVNQLADVLGTDVGAVLDALRRPTGVMTRHQRRPGPPIPSSRSGSGSTTPRAENTFATCRLHGVTRRPGAGE